MCDNNYHCVKFCGIKRKLNAKYWYTECAWKHWNAMHIEQIYFMLCLLLVYRCFCDSENLYSTTTDTTLRQLLTLCTYLVHSWKIWLFFLFCFRCEFFLAFYLISFHFFLVHFGLSTCFACTYFCKCVRISIF